MGSINDSSYDKDDFNNFTGARQSFRRRTLNHGQFRIPRRYIIAFMFLVLLIIEIWKEINVSFMLVYAMAEGDASIHYPTIANWTILEVNNYMTTTLVAVIFAQMPGAILIFFFSAYKVLIVSVSLSAFLHLLTPVALQHHSYSLVAVLLSQTVVVAPIHAAIISMWKDWAPPLERSNLVLVSYFGYYLGIASAPLYPLLYQYVTNRWSYYLAGSCGLVWSFLWFVVISDTPSNDPLITEKELLYLEDKIAPEIKERSNLRDVPWISIILSKPVIAACVIYMKFICSRTVILFAGSDIVYNLQEYKMLKYFFLAFALSYAVILTSSAFLMDFLKRKFQGYITHIRKGFICGAFILHAAVLLGVLSKSLVVKAIIFCVSYGILSISIPAFITLALDLSPRYVTIIAGVIYTFYALADTGFAFYVEAMYSYSKMEPLDSLYLFDGLITLFAAGIFGYWGSAEEQPWSLTTTTIAKSNDYLSYPKPEDEDDSRLVTGTV